MSREPVMTPLVPPPPLLTHASQSLPPCMPSMQAVCLMLIDRGADVNLVDEFGNNALIGAAKHGHDDVVQLLRRHQARWARAEPDPAPCFSHPALLLPSRPA